MRGLSDRVVIVAGAATGIGAASATRLAEEGAAVVVGDINAAGAEDTAQRIRAAGGTAVAVEYDQSDDASIGDLVGQALERYERLDGLHANAADLRPEIIGGDVELTDMDPALWERTLRVNLIGYAVLIRHALPHLLDNGGGGIVCTSSDASSIGEPTRPAYAASKAGVNALIRHVASRWGKEGIRCNAVAPGLVLSETARASLDEDFMTQMRDAHRSPRLGQPGDIAGAVAYLLSDDGAWINGQVWSVNGGVFLRD
jgi:NAD(P)-dependent dehydrogenase (short-subunit alcohol dehydrogenase family)